MRLSRPVVATLTCATLIASVPAPASARESAPDTDSCPQATWPPKPKTTSEAAGPIPDPLPVDYDGNCGVSAPDGFSVDESVLASAWLVADIDTGDVVAMKDPHGRYRPASIIKVLLALVVIDELPLDREVTVSEESAAMEGSSAGIGAGGHYTVDDLLHGILMASGNDTAHALAQELGGDEATLEKINRLIDDLGMADTRVPSYTGLDAAGMSTSAWDMGLAYRAAFNNPTFSQIVATKEYPFPGFDDLPGFEMWNDNALLLNDPDGIGGKTGFTDDAQHTFAGAVDHDGRRLMAIVLETTVDKARAWEQAQHLLHESYRFDGPGVATLEAAAEGTTTLTPGPTPDPPVVAEVPTPSSAGFPWFSAGIVAAIVALAAVASWFSLALTRKSSRHQQPRAQRRRR